MGDNAGGRSCPAPGFFMKALYALCYRKSLFAAAALLLGFGLLSFLFQPCLFVESETKLLAWFAICPNEEAFSLRFIHSVERTPVVEKYKVDSQNKLLLFATEYQSFGVGLPFLASEGRLTAKDGYFSLEMNRVYPSISLRTGPEAQLTLTGNKQQYVLYKMLPAGSLVRIWAGTWLSRMIDVFHIKSEEGG